MSGPMGPEIYTAGTICQAMGLDGFVDPAWATAGTSALRVLLLPSFHPEACVTLTRDGAGAALEVIVLREMLWHQAHPRRLADWSEAARLDPGAFDELANDFAAADEEVARNQRAVCIDGMAAACVSAAGATSRQFRAHTYLPAVGAFVRAVIQIARGGSRDPHVRNGLAACARYVGQSLPLEPEPPAPPVAYVAVLGVPAERRELRRALDAVRTRRPTDGT